MNKVVVAGGGVLGTQIGLMCVYTGHDVTFWLRSESSVDRTTPKIERYRKSMLDKETMVNELLVRNGYARTLTIKPTTKYQERLYAAELSAKKSSSRLWKTSVFK